MLVLGVKGSKVSVVGFPPCHQPLNTLVSSLLQESELTELKDTIDILKAKNTEAQEIIQGALSNPEITPKGPEYALKLPYD